MKTLSNLIILLMSSSELIIIREVTTLGHQVLNLYKNKEPINVQALKRTAPIRHHNITGSYLLIKAILMPYVSILRLLITK